MNSTRLAIIIAGTAALFVAATRTMASPPLPSARSSDVVHAAPGAAATGARPTIYIGAHGERLSASSAQSGTRYIECGQVYCRPHDTCMVCNCNVSDDQSCSLCVDTCSPDEYMY